MKILLKIVSALTLVTTVIGCNTKHAENDGHSHGESKQEEAHPESGETITSLTEQQVKTVGITFGNIEEKGLTAVIKANGVLRVPNLNKATVTSLYGGIIRSLKIELGDYVKKGQVIATIANPQFIQLQEEYITLDARITLAEQELQRQTELNEGNAGAKKNLQIAISELSTLRTRRSSLQKQIQLMGINPASVNNNSLQSLLVITSPISGTVSNIFAQLGSYVDVSSPVAEVVDNNSLHLDLQVFERDLPKMKVGQTINFMITNNPAETYTAKVYSIGSTFENASKTIAVHSSVIGKKSGLIDGMNITGTVNLSNVSSMAVPYEAIVEADGKYYIFVLTDKGPAGHQDHGHAEEEHDHVEPEAASPVKDQTGTMNFEKIEVVKGVSDMGYTAITPVSDISPSARIVTKGAFFINARLSNTGGHEH